VGLVPAGCHIAEYLASGELPLTRTNAAAPRKSKSASSCRQSRASDALVKPWRAPAVQEISAG